MAATFTLLSEAGRRPRAPTFHHVVRVQGDGSYPEATGGYPVDLDALEVKGDVINDFVSVDYANGWYAKFNRATSKIQLYVVATGAEVANAVNVGAFDEEMVLISQ